MSNYANEVNDKNDILTLQDIVETNNKYFSYNLIEMAKDVVKAERLYEISKKDVGEILNAVSDLCCSLEKKLFYHVVRGIEEAGYSIIENSQKGRKK